VFVVGGLCGYVVVPIAEALNDTAPTVEWTSVFGLALAALTVSVLALSTYRTVHREQRRIPPQRALNFLIFAKACAFAGSFIVGGYLGFASHFVDQMEAPLPRERVYRSIVAAVAAAVVVFGGLLLERACRVPRDDDDSH
jgi:amino acid permease